MQDIAKPPNGEAMGKAFAMGLSSLVGAFEKDPNAAPDASWLDSRKGLETSMAEVSNAQTDPQWRVKGQLMANQVLEQRAQLAAQGALAEERRKETSAWMEDAPKLAPWITATPEERKGMASPDAKSKIGMQTLQKQSLADQRYYTSQDQMANKLDQERLKAEHSAGITAKVADWNDALGSVDPATFSAISALKDQKGVVNGGRLPNGLPTPEAISILNGFRTSNGMTLYGTKASEYLEKPGKMSAETKVQLDDLRSDESDLRRRIDAKSKNGEPTDDLEAQLEDVKAQRKALAGGKAIAGTESKPKDNFQRDTDKLLHEINQFTAQGKDKEVKQKKEELNVLNKTYVLDRNGVVLGRKLKDVEKNQLLAQQPVGTPYYDEVTGKLKVLDQKAKDMLSQTVQEPSKPSSSKPSAWRAESPVDRKSALDSRITAIQDELKSKDWFSEDRDKRRTLEARQEKLQEELDRLKSERKKLDNGTFKFLSTPAAL